MDGAITMEENKVNSLVGFQRIGLRRCCYGVLVDAALLVSSKDVWFHGLCYGTKGWVLLLGYFTGYLR